MWITGQVEVPETVLLAQQRGQLVVFVGAGVSVAPPSALPLFVPLAERIAADAREPVTDEAKTHPDLFLGRLESNGVPVHERVKTFVEQSARPNRLHEALVRLFPSLEQLRIVTTNYDQHLTTAAVEHFGAPPQVYRAPALPLGRDFTGIVHLHGSVDQRPQDLVVTGRDFGKAYLTDGWAARFLPEMFRTYTVLFVGYSHKDQVMTYLAHGLPPESQRFGFIDNTVPSEWTAMGITGLPYPSADHHVALRDALENWATRSGMGLLDHERLVRDLVATPAPDTDGTVHPVEIPKDPVTLSYLEHTIADPTTVGFFTKHATDVVWLSWASEQAPFAPMFRPSEEIDPLPYRWPSGSRIVSQSLRRMQRSRWCIAGLDGCIPELPRHS